VQDLASILIGMTCGLGVIGVFTALTRSALHADARRPASPSA
jgi:hypothetical protein